MAQIAAIKMISIAYPPVKKGKSYLISHPETAAKHIAFGWGKLSDDNSPVMKGLTDDKKKRANEAVAELKAIEAKAKELKTKKDA